MAKVSNDIETDTRTPVRRRAADLVTRFQTASLPPHLQSSDVSTLFREIEYLRSRLEDVVSDYAATACDHPSDCDCSMGLAVREVSTWRLK